MYSINVCIAKFGSIIHGIILIVVLRGHHRAVSFAPCFAQDRRLHVVTTMGLFCGVWFPLYTVDRSFHSNKEGGEVQPTALQPLSMAGR